MNSEIQHWLTTNYDNYYDKLVGYSYVICKDSEMAKDAVSDVFLDLIKRHEKGERKTDITAYLFTSVKHRTLRLLALSKKKNGDIGHELEISSNVDPSKLLVSKELEEILTNAKSKLSDKTLLVFDLIKEEGYSYKKVGNELQISIETVKYHMKIALKVIRTELDNYNKHEARVVQLRNTLASFLFF